jgi:hypothetical protein
LVIIIIGSDYNSKFYNGVARSLNLLSLGTGTTFFLQIFQERFLGRQPIPTEFDPLDLPFTHELAKVSRRKTTELGSLLE